jgi:homoserine O-acetyltransferase/O-succinyltransferase
MVNSCTRRLRSVACVLSLLAILAQLARGGDARAADAMQMPLGTFSIVAFDPATGDLGIAVASKVLGVGSIVPWARANVGAIATQSAANTSYGPEGLDLLAAGRDAAETLRILTEADGGRDFRQLGIVDAKGRAVAFTGPECQGWAGHVVGDHYTVQGNILAGEQVLEDMAAAYEEARQTPDSELADWLMAALAAADAAGGDKRGKQSAALMVVRDKAGYGENDRYIDLRVEDDADPVAELARLLGVHKEFFAGAHERKPVRANYPPPQEGDVVLRDFAFRSGERLAELRMHYLALGRAQRDDQGDVKNAVLILHGTNGSSDQFLRPEFATEMFGPGQPLDAARWYIVIPDNLGHGKSTRPSDGLRGQFPKYGYLDMIEAQRRMLAEGLGVERLRLVIGTSMGGMHAWLWGQTYPDAVDALVPLASLPTQISGRNRVWRRVVIDAIRHDPHWQNGEYVAQPQGLRTALEMLYLMGSNPQRRQKDGPTLAAADRALDNNVADRLRTSDANDVLYAVEASRDYDPGPGLERITAPLLAINFADDLINPPELGVLEREIKRVPQGRALTIPASDETSGHGTHTSAAVWKDELVEFMDELDLEP